MFLQTLKRPRLILFVLLISASGFSQTLYPPKVVSPNQASLGKFGEVPVDLQTGVPNISIPLYTLSYGNIDVPISLRYHPSSVKPSQQPGWVGSGWDLQSIGSISRQIRGVEDEEYVDDATSANYRFYYPFPPTSDQAGAECGGDLTNIYPWFTTQQLIYDFNPGNALGTDVEADEFSFDVMGHSGKFYYGGITKGWQVISDENIKIDMTEFFSPMQIAKAIQSYQLPNGSSAPRLPTGYQSRSFGSFTLTMPDGTKYIFGGSDAIGTPDAVEFCCPMNVVDQHATSFYWNEPFTITSWLLKSIVDVYGNSVTFNYDRKYPTCNLSYSASNYFIEVTGQNCNGTVPPGGTSFDKNKLSGLFQWPMYLQSINSPNGSVNFDISDAVCNRYTDDQLTYPDAQHHSESTFDLSLLGPYYPDQLKTLRWEKLDKITITDNFRNSTGINNYQTNIIKQYQFDYNNTPEQRLMLGYLQILDKKSTTIGQYQFKYNGDFNDRRASIVYANGDFSDHWGFFNDTQLPDICTDFIYVKAPVAEVVTTELLQELYYPTGGHTEFSWESNDYSQVVSSDRQSLNNTGGYGGGSRISEIKDFSSDHIVAFDKKYYYKNNFKPGSDLNQLPSSGVLNGTPQYFFSFYNRPGISGLATFSGTITTMIGTGNYSYTGQGSPVAYKEVDEVNLDGSYTRNLFTSYDEDINGVSHYDKAPINHLAYQTGDTYFQYSSLENERSKPVATYVFNSQNILLKKLNFIYRDDYDRFEMNPIHLIDGNAFKEYDNEIFNGGTQTNNEVLSCSDQLVFATARLAYTYSYWLAEQTETDYDQNGNNPLVKYTFFSYNVNNLVTSKTETNSKGDKIVTSYTYPTDYSDQVSLGMVASHLLSPVIQTSVTTNDIHTILHRSSYYQPNGSFYVPQNIEIQTRDNKSEIREQINQYDSRGHPLEVQKPGDVKDVYIWGCNSQYLLAKITGSDYKTASSLIDQKMLDQADVGYNSYTDKDIRNELNKLRTGLPNAFVTTYTYACGIGMTSQTDPAGHITYYEYDNLERLRLIRDQDQNIVKKFDYQLIVPAGTDPDWEQTGNIRCKPCDQNSLYTSIIQQHEEMDKNKESGTYQQTRWIDDGESNTCKEQQQAWSDISVPACQVINGNNSGYQVWQQKDINPCSSTYGNTREQVSGTRDITACPVQPQSCSFNMAVDFYSPENEISDDGTTTSFFIVFNSATVTMTKGQSYIIANISEACRPQSERILHTIIGGRNWTIIIEPNGNMSWQMSYEDSDVAPNNTISTGTLSYNLYD